MGKEKQCSVGYLTLDDEILFDIVLRACNKIISSHGRLESHFRETAIARGRNPRGLWL